MGGSFVSARARRPRAGSFDYGAAGNAARRLYTSTALPRTWSHAITAPEPPSVARGFLFADLRNYSAWVESHGDHAAAILLRAYRDLVRQAVAEFDGAEIKTEGDSFYVVFGSPSAALNCGLRILELAAESQAAAGAAIPVGIGVHAGETVAMDDGYVGSVVNVAARVCAQAAAGELLVTDAVRSLTRTYLDVTFLPRGRKRLKGISEPVSLYRVVPRRRRCSGTAVAVCCGPLADRRRGAGDPRRGRGICTHRRGAHSRSHRRAGIRLAGVGQPDPPGFPVGVLQRIGRSGRSIPRGRGDGAASVASHPGPGEVPAGRCRGSAGRHS